jgi:hypothetical protein
MAHIGFESANAGAQRQGLADPFFVFALEAPALGAG